MKMLYIVAIINAIPIKYSRLMKKVVLFFLGMMSWAFAHAQATTCEPDQSVPDTVVVSPLPQSAERPDGGITDTACVAEYFEFVYTFNIPPTYTTPFGPAPITSVQVAVDGAVENLPASFDYICNPPNCVFNANTKGCVVLFGTATAGQEGPYDLKVVADVNITGVPLPLTLTLPDDLEPDSHYFLVVKPEGSENCFTLDAYERFAAHFSLSSQPNPTSGWAQIQVDARLGGTFDFIVSDIFGQALYRRRVTILPGGNTIGFDGSHLPNGVYLYSLSNGREMVTQKMLISRH